MHVHEATCTAAGTTDLRHLGDRGGRRVPGQAGRGVGLRRMPSASLDCAIGIALDVPPLQARNQGR
eukprot:8462395-Lingulodinium_polyedra.AAC.1